MRADEPFGLVLQRFAPFVWVGLVVMALSGLILVIGEPVREFSSLSFWIKMGLVATAVASAVAFRLSLNPARLSTGSEAAGPEFPAAAKSAAAATIVLWLAIIFLGRAIAYDIEVWGAWSLSTRL
jgi:hypothetical protein